MGNSQNYLGLCAIPAIFGKIIAANLEFIELWGYEDNKYDTLLDMYEPGMTVAKLDEVFGSLRKKLVPLVARIEASKNQPKTTFLRQTFSKEQQKSIQSLYP